MPLYDFKCRKCSHEFEALVLKNLGQVAADRGVAVQGAVPVPSYDQ